MVISSCLALKYVVFIKPLPLFLYLTSLVLLLLLYTLSHQASVSFC